MANNVELKPVKISELQAASKLEQSMLFATEQNGIAKKVTGAQLVELSKGEPGHAGPIGPAGKDGEDGFSPTVEVSDIDGGHAVTITAVNGVSTFNVENGKEGKPGQDGKDGPQGAEGLQGPQGEMGPPFLIYKVYPTIEDMNAGFDTDGLLEGQLVGISSETGGENAGRIYIKGASEYEFFFDLSNVDGIAGPQGIQGEQGPEGKQGEQGAPGTPGKDGVDGISATISTEPIDGGNKVTLTDYTHSETINIMNGEKGDAGPGLPPGGERGQIPVKSSTADYETEWQDIPDSGIDFTTDDTLEMSYDNVLGVKTPAKPITQEKYAQLTDDEKQKSAVYLVDEPPFIPASASIQEYDAEVDGCQWHVRKWSNGYVEMSGIKTYGPMSVNAAWGNGGIYNSSIGFIYYPMELNRKYSENISLQETENTTLWLMVSGQKGDLTHTSELSVGRVNTASNVKVLLSLFVTGRWK